ncbi:DNA protection during starvation protein [Rhodovastum atsumiense]|uniref:DNA starvation/stationary phase protection protein Dps n=1 Tax=Rhodovastum atsumiense TaxID=504468 RepID=A0A5M6IJV7_9PROT|nr:DNA starvation/stationary phase protection protein Dps [Rhodovastum atsumiense]KAA5608554.1 DNA starvation/stationary phase protection protein Dps [Rhodovastum atsumiense]CAH2599973.1 DNA protection during starvation protein [Rhodovastum atsumiense]
MPSLQTANALDSNAKKVAVSLLNARLADAIDLALVVKQAHWNLRGPDFIAVHKMLDEFRTDVDEYVDTIAERVSQLGAIALGTSQAVAQTSQLAPYPTDIIAVEAHLQALLERTAVLANQVRRNIDEVAEAGDANSADIFTEVSRGLDKWLWFLEAHQRQG